MTLNVSTQANVTFLNVSSTAFLSNANIITANIWSANVTTGNVTTLNVSGLATLFQSNLATANITSLNVSTQANVTFLNVSSSAFLSNANVLTANVTSLNVSTQANVTYLNVSSSAFLSNANVLTANVTSLNVSTQANVTFLNVSSTAYLSSANIITGNIATANIASLNVTGDANVANVTVRSNLYASNIIMSSNLSTNTGYGNVYLTGNLVVQGNIFSLGGSVGSGSGTSQGILYSLASPYSLGSSFATGSAGPGIAGYHINLSPTYFNPEATQSVSAFSAGTGMLKFATGGLYQVTCVIVGDQPIVKLAFGKTSSSSFAALPTSAISGYDYVYNFPVGSSPSTVITIPLTVQDTSQYYYLDVFFSTAAGTPSTLYPTRSTTAAGSNYGTYVQVGPFGNYLTSATGVASGLLMNCYGTTTLSSPITSNTFRLAMTSSNGWTVNGVSTVLNVTSGGNFQISQVGIYEVSLCLNPSATPMMFGVGSLGTDTAPTQQGPYLYQYAPMYTQDPTTVVSLPLNITDTSKYYYLDVIFPGTQATVALSNVSTFVSLKPVGSYVSPSTNPWSQQGSSVYYTGGAVGIGGVNPSLLTETLTVNGSTAFIGNVTVTSDASSNNYVLARRTPTGSLDVTQYLTGRVPLTTTTNLIQNYLANVSLGTQDSNVVVNFPSVNNSNVMIGPSHSVVSNLQASNIFMEAWVYLTATNQTNNILKQGGDWLWQVTGAQYKQTFTATGISTFNGISTTGLAISNWYHIAVSYVASAKTKYYFLNGTLDGSQIGGAGSAQFTPAAAISIGEGWTGSIRDVRVMKNCIVPVATFTGGAQAAPFTTAPTYVTGMNTGYSSNLALALQSQYFPGASTAPYGPVLTLPGTVGSYYMQSIVPNSQWNTVGACFECWINYPSFANSNIFSGGEIVPYSFGLMNPTTTGVAWSFGGCTDGSIALCSGGSLATSSFNTPAGLLKTGQWNHIMWQSNGSNVYMAVNGVFQVLTTLHNPSTYGNNTIAPSIAGTTPNPVLGYPIVVGSGNNVTPTFALAKARLVYGTSVTPTLGNVYSSGNFTANPNFGPVPAGATVAWQLESQYPLPTFPSIQDVTPLALQSGSYGSVPTPVGGVTSNVLGPYSTTYPQLDSIRFDGTGYIDYGNAASSVMNSNLWASPWTIEGWVYPTNVVTSYNGIVAKSNTATNDWFLYLNTGSGALTFAHGQPAGTIVYNTGSLAPPLNTWTHVAATYDGTRSNIYVGGALSNSMTATTTAMTFTPTLGVQVGTWTQGAQNFYGNLADVRVSNVARYTGSSFTVPTAQMPFTTDANTLLLLKSLGGQTGQTLEIQGRGLGSTSIGASQTVRAYPPAPMSSYLLDTTSNASVTYGQGKYVASASSEGGSTTAWMAFSKTNGFNIPDIWYTGNYNGSSPYNYTGSVTTVDTLGNSYAGEWLQIQLPVSVVLSSYSLSCQTNSIANSPSTFVLLGSRDGAVWTLVNRQAGFSPGTNGATNTFAVSTTQAYTYYRLATQNVVGYSLVSIGELILNGTEEALCVTSDSKVGVGIANPQRALEVAGDLVVSGTISGGAGLGGFRNRIINGDMRIAQRGTSATVTSSTTYGYYITDRWALETTFASGSANLYQNVLSTSDTPYQLGLRYSSNIVVNSAITGLGYLAIQQRIEYLNFQDMNWGTSFGSPATISLWYKTNVASGSIIPISLRAVYNGTSYCYGYSTTSGPPNSWQYVAFTVPPPPNTASPFGASTSDRLDVVIGPGVVVTTVTPGTWYSAYSAYGIVGQTNIYSQAGNYIAYTGVQLEKGTVATPFEVRPYATELALCQRYYQKTFSQGSYAGQNVNGAGAIYTIANGTTEVLGSRFVTTMRAIPVVTMYNPYTTTTTGVIGVGSSGADTAAATAGTIGDSGFRLVSSSGLTGGLVYQYHYTASAEL